MITLSQALEESAKFSINPVFSLFRTDSQGNYDLILKTGSIPEIVERFKKESISQFISVFGLEIRCDGMTVKFDRA